MNRRNFIVGTYGLALTALGDPSQRAAAAEKNPSFDPSYDQLPTAEEQTKDLDSEALGAQAKPRTVHMMPVTGLPHDLGKFDEQSATMIKNAGIVGVSFAIAVDRQLVVTRGFGHLSSHDKAPATPTNPGYLGSITKPLCAFAGLTLVKAGKLKLDQKVVDLLPMEPLLKEGEKRQPGIDHVTVRMLMNHTSGLFNVVEDLFDRAYYKQLAAKGKLELVHGDISQYDLVRRGMARPFVSKPGAEYHYSGQGLQVLGRIVEKLSGQRLDKYISSKVLTPLGVKHHATLSYLSPEQLAQIDAGNALKTHTFIPSPYNEAKKVCESWAYKKPVEDLYGNHWGQADACGSSMLSAVDLLRFVTFCVDLLNKELIVEALTPTKREPFSNGLGWGVSMNQGRFQYGHGGAWGGIRAFCESTWDNVQYAVLSAGDQDDQFNAIAEKVLALGRSLRDKKATAIGWQRYGFK
jgi:CubicO group peptidase (beta-lactamase class C family)